MNKLAIRVLFFDAAGTLFHTRGSVGELYLKIARKYGSTATREALDEAFFDVFRSTPPPAGSVNAREEAWWRDVVRQVFQRVGTVQRFEDYFQEVYSVFKGSQGWELFPETIDTLTRLKTKGYALGMITNFDSRVRAVNQALGLAPFLESVTLSVEAGAAKPDPRIFREALKRHRIQPEEAAHIGDSPSDDVAGALNAGLRAVLIDRQGAFKPESGYVKIESLTELLDTF